MNKFHDFTLAQWLFYLENRHQQEIRLGLSRIQDAAARLNVLNQKAVVITVGGTNGKGSTVAALEAVYTAAGYRVGSYTSPHLLAFNERIRINHQPIVDKVLCAAFIVLQQLPGSEQLSYFEMTTLAALWYFQQQALDVVILEVGMGGRQDATNIIDADLAIITTVDLDHQDYLGDTIEAIGYEKAGILRANKPFIYADTNPPQSIMDYARLLQAYPHCLGENYSYKTIGDRIHIFDQHNELAEVSIPAINHQDAVAAIMASYYLNPRLPVTPAHWQQAMRQVSIPGRQQLVEENAITTIFDVAHNPQAVSLLAQFVEKQPKKAVHAVFSALKDKDLSGLIKPMRNLIDFWYPAMMQGKRASSEALLTTVFDQVLNSTPHIFADPAAAYRQAMQQANPGDLIVVYGSFLMVSAVMAAESNHTKQEIL